MGPAEGTGRCRAAVARRKRGGAARGGGGAAGLGGRPGRRRRAAGRLDRGVAMRAAVPGPARAAHDVHDDRDTRAVRVLPRRYRLPRLLIAATALLTALLCGPAVAHKASDAYLSLRV